MTGVLTAVVSGALEPSAPRRAALAARAARSGAAGEAAGLLDLGRGEADDDLVPRIQGAADHLRHLGVVAVGDAGADLDRTQRVLVAEDVDGLRLPPPAAPARTPGPRGEIALRTGEPARAAVRHRALEALPAGAAAAALALAAVPPRPPAPRPARARRARGRRRARGARRARRARRALLARIRPGRGHRCPGTARRRRCAAGLLARLGLRPEAEGGVRPAQHLAHLR